MYSKLNKTIEIIARQSISEERKQLLQPLIDYVQTKVDSNQSIQLNFICTHNSRRSHLAQVWAQTMAYYFRIKNVVCFSGGTEVTAMFPKVGEILATQGFQIQQVTLGNNPEHAVTFSERAAPVICFSKTFDDTFNPQRDFAAVMTCSSADEVCPFIAGAEKRLPVRYDDPKSFDETDLMDQKYTERSLEIAAEMYYVFSKINQE